MLVRGLVITFTVMLRRGAVRLGGVLGLLAVDEQQLRIDLAALLVGREQLHRAIETFERVLGERPLGWNCRSWPSQHTRELLIEEGGFLYDSDGSADDLPYYARAGGVPFLVVPYSKTYNDSRYLMNPGFASPRDFLETLTMGIDELARDDRPSMMTVAVHARWSGQAARAAAMRAFLEHAATVEGVRFMRRIDIARWWLATYPQ